MRAWIVGAALLVFASSADARPHHKRAPARSRAARISIHEPVRGQSVGAPWAGRLANPVRLPAGDGYTIRRPQRAYGTRTTVELIERAVAELRDRFPEAHVLAIGDLSAEHGGAISDHHSHQSGRDADIGLVYKHKPAAYPQSFVRATADNLDAAATYALVDAFAATADRDGGVQVMFLDFDVQGVLCDWAEAHGVGAAHLARLFQYPHGRGVSAGLVRHEPNHDNHLHVRFQCPRGDHACR